MYRAEKSPQKSVAENPLLLTESEAARSLRISPRSLLRLRTAGKIGYVLTTERRIGYEQTELLAYIQRQRKDATNG